MTEIRLSERDMAFIEEQVKAGVYKDADEVVAAEKLSNDIKRMAAEKNTGTC